MIDMQKSLIVLQALLEGKTVELDNRFFKLFKRGNFVSVPGIEDGEVDTNYWLGIHILDNNTLLPTDRFLGTDYSFTTFLALCDNIKDDELKIINI
jgi:hypothetical protein